VYFTIPRFAKISFIWHGFGTREYGPTDLEKEARERGLEPVLLDQVHSDRIHILAELPETPLRGDALLTAASGLLLTIKTADCLPALLVDERRRAIAAVHCGWKGTRRLLLQKVVGEMGAVFGSAAADLLVALGPCIGPACYEVGEDVRVSMVSAGLGEQLFQAREDRRGKYDFDLRGANLQQLRASGIPERNVFSIAGCTHCEKYLYSYRREHQEAGRLLNFIGLFTV
jgi:YfiH family protein